MARRKLSLDDYVEGVRSADRAVLGRAITLMESRHPRHQEMAEAVLDALLPHTGSAHRVGITGVPGVGKSTFVEALGMFLISQGHRVAVLAVDPSSTRTGGSILGDKTRMERLSQNPSAFIRPSPTSGTLGGVAAKTRETMLVCEAAGFDVVLVETVGVGQSELAVAQMTDFFLLLMLAGAGDELQGIKRGIMELADAVAINKADGDNVVKAKRAATTYETALRYLRPDDTWKPRVHICSGLEELGISTIWDTVLEHRAHREAEGAFEALRQKQLLGWLWSMVDDQLRVGLMSHEAVRAALPDIERAVVAGELAPTSAARKVLLAFGF